MNQTYAPSLLVLFFSLLAISSCSSWEPSSCSNGEHCPPGYACNASNVCIELWTKCGNAIREHDEACDDGNNVAGDGCSSDCRTNETCGNNFPDEHEKCDDGNRDDGDGCSSDCQSDETCGNGDTDRIKGEECDDGNDIAGDGCKDCVAEICGNGRKDVGEVCDPDPLDLLASYCNKECTSDGDCGNGIKDPLEVCDDGNEIPGDGCSANCKSLEVCGDGFVDEARGEECDCGNDEALAALRGPDCNEPNSLLSGFCRPDCQKHCGDGLFAGGEVCDPSHDSPVFCAGRPSGDEDELYDLGVVSCTTCVPDYTSCGTITILQNSPDLPSVTEKMNGIWRIEVAGVFAVGNKGIIQRRGAVTWDIENGPVASSLPLFDVGGSDSENIFAVGASGTILKRDSEMGPDEKFDWQAVLDSDLPDDFKKTNLYGVWVSPSGEIFAVGALGTILHRRDRETGWHLDSSQTTEDLHDVWGNEHGIFVVGTSGTILWRELAGSSPEPEWDSSSHGDDDYHALWGNAEALYAVGTSGRIIRFLQEEGGSGRWVDEQSPTDKSLTGIFGSSPDDLFAVGEDGTIIRRSGDIWSPVRSRTNRNFRDVFVADRTVITVGDHGEKFSFTY